MNYEELKQKASEFQMTLELPAGSEPHELIARLEVLNMLIAQTGKYLADAKYLQDEAVNTAIVDIVTQDSYQYSASTLNSYVKAKARDYNYLVTMFDRINAAAVHQIDSLRSILSYKKSEMLL
jgi:hypothetical protein